MHFAIGGLERLGHLDQSKTRMAYRNLEESVRNHGTTCNLASPEKRRGGGIDWKPGKAIL